MADAAQPPVEEDVVQAPPPQDKQKAKDQPLWLEAWYNPLAGVRTFSSCIELADINGNGDWKLLIADGQRRLKVFSGTDLVLENPLLDTPCALCSLYTDYSDAICRPAMAVASGSNVYIYKNLKPFYKFFLPCNEINPVEADVWANLRQAKITTNAAVELLEHTKENGVTLSTRSVELLSLETTEERENYIGECKNTPLIQQTVVTAMTVLKKDKEEATGIGYLVLGTENNRVLILDSQFQILKKIHLVSAPVFMCASGLYDVDYRLVVSCRNGNIYTIKNGELLGVAIELESQPCGMIRVDKSILVGTMGNVMHAYHVKGKKQYSVYFPAPITNMCPIQLETLRGTKACIIALANGEVRVYNGKSLINTMQVHDTVSGLKYGRYGREDSTLIITTKSGAIIVKVLPRLASLEVTKGQHTGPPPEQDIPLKVPKKTKLYVEQTQREKDFGIEMHRVFQRDLCKLRLQTARAYVKILTDGQGPLSYTGGSSLRLTAHVQGLGPLFKIKLNIQNTGLKALTSIPIIFTYNKTIYQMWKPSMIIPVLVPSLVYHYEVAVRCIEESAGSDVIRVYVCSANSSVPIITALVNMPLTDFLLP
ncbi:Bardet-Biedl syndrome 1 protein-like protein [Diplonema papillatum]|nr:Bardet-Biedl syndrome 1 protein-like protein [Diplonema papillatum]